MSNRWFARTKLLAVSSAVLVFTIFYLPIGPIAAQQERPSELRSPRSSDNKPYKRWWWDFYQRAYPYGDIPGGMRERAMAQIQELDAARRFELQPVQGEKWAPIGPAPIEGGQLWEAANRPVSGRVADVAIDPVNPQHWLIGAALGGIWETFDRGRHWFPRTDDQPALAMGAIAFATGNPAIVYAGTGEAIGRPTGYFGAGMLKSTDGGRTWKPIKTAPPFENVCFSDIRVHPRDPQVVVAAVYDGGIAGIGRNGSPTSSAGGIWRSENGGEIWSRVLDRNGFATDLEADTNSGNFDRLLAALGLPYGSSNNGVYRSTDKGKSWSLVPNQPWKDSALYPGGTGRIEMALSPSTPDVLYVSVAASSSSQSSTPGVANPVSNNQLLGLWRTDNAWDTNPTWKEITSARTGTNGGRDISKQGGPLVPGYCGLQCDYDHEIIVDPGNPNTLFAGGISLWRCEDCNVINNSSTAKWTDITALPHIGKAENSIHVDQHAMAWVSGPPRAASSAPTSVLGGWPLMFEANVGQAEKGIQYLAKTRNYTLLLGPDGPVLSGRRNGGSEGKASRGKKDPGAVRMNLVGGNPNPRIAGLGELPGKIHYLAGKDSRNWKPHIPAFSSVRYGDVYPGVDMLFYGSREGIEYDLIVTPRTSPRDIRLRFQGVEKLELDAQGDLLLHTPEGLFRQKRPRIYQLGNEQLAPVGGSYVLCGEEQVSFQVAAYDTSRPLVIDPQIEYVSYFGSADTDVGMAIASDAAGNIYLAGQTVSGSQQPYDDKIFVAKLDPSAPADRALLYLTYLSGKDQDQPASIAVDGSGSAYVAGWTASPDFPSNRALSLPGGRARAGGIGRFCHQAEARRKRVDVLHTPRWQGMGRRRRCGC